jgi:lipopolysaccharide transport system permease protein
VHDDQRSSAISKAQPRVVYTPRGRSGESSRATFFAHRELIVQLVRRELARRYRGRLLGLLWLVLQPLLLLALYTFVFGVVFGARWPGFEGEETLGFAIVVFTGLLTFGILAETLNASPRLILSNRALIKNVEFPVEVLPVVTVACALVQAIAGLAILLPALVVLGYPLSMAVLALPLVWLSLALLCLGLCYLLSALGVFLRDLEGVVGLAVTGLLFGSAIFYPLSQVPESARSVLVWLPTCFYVEATRDILLRGQISFGEREAVMLVVTLAVAIVGYRSFVWSKGAFADVL